MEYFGTDLKEHGHYRWLLGENRLEKNWKNFDDLPFHPEYLNNKQQNGDVSFFQGSGFTVLAICGSPIDKRPGSKSVFWVKLTIEKSEMIEMIKNNKVAMNIIDNLSFEVKW